MTELEDRVRDYREQVEREQRDNAKWARREDWARRNLWPLYWLAHQDFTAVHQYSLVEENGEFRFERCYCHATRLLIRETLSGGWVRVQ